MPPKRATKVPASNNDIRDLFSKQKASHTDTIKREHLPTTDDPDEQENVPPKRKQSSLLVSEPSDTPATFTTTLGEEEIPPLKKVKKTSASDLSNVTAEDARRTINWLNNGGDDEKFYGKAKTTRAGCVIPQKKPQGYYIQVSVQRSSRNSRGVAGSTVKKDRSGNGPGAHQLVVLGWGTDEGAESIRNGTAQASHLCHNSLCVNTEHIVAEDRAINEARKKCAKQMQVAYVRKDDGSWAKHVKETDHVCTHTPKCLYVDIGNMVAAP